MAEHIKVTLPELDALDKRIDALEDEARALKFEQQQLIDAEARKVAKFASGYEFERGKARYRITSVVGEYYGGPEGTIYVRYNGHKLFKNGKADRTRRLYPNGF